MRHEIDSTENTRPVNTEGLVSKTDAELKKVPPAGLPIEEWAKLGLQSATKAVNASEQSRS